jgi:hypothetical protein
MKGGTANCNLKQCSFYFMLNYFQMQTIGADYRTYVPSLCNFLKAARWRPSSFSIWMSKSSHSPKIEGEIKKRGRQFSTICTFSFEQVIRPGRWQPTYKWKQIIAKQRFALWRIKNMIILLSLFKSYLTEIFRRLFMHKMPVSSVIWTQLVLFFYTYFYKMKAAIKFPNNSERLNLFISKLCFYKIKIQEQLWI